MGRYPVRKRQQKWEEKHKLKGSNKKYLIPDTHRGANTTVREHTHFKEKKKQQKRQSNDKRHALGEDGIGTVTAAATAHIFACKLNNS